LPFVQAGRHTVTVSPLDPLRTVFGERLDALAGGVVSGEIPITADVVNRVIASRLTRSDLPIVGAEVVVLERDAFTVHLRPRVPIPVLRLDVQIDQQPELPAQPVIGMRWALRGLGPLGLLAGPVMAYLKTMPPGIRLEGDRVWVDVEEILRQRGLGEILPLLTRLRVTTRDRRFVVAFELRR
jgi:hypothetical protein